jgi:hypothetical protein
VDKGIENLLARLRRQLLDQIPAAEGLRAKFMTQGWVEHALEAAYEAGRAEVARDQAPCDAMVRPPGTEPDRLAKCMRLAGHGAPHESADGCQWWSGADGSVLAALSRSDDAESPSGSGPALGQVDVES